MSSRTIQNYELGERMPRNLDTVKKLADVLGTTSEDLLGNSGLLIVVANEQGGASAARDITQLVEEVTGLFSGGKLDESFERSVLDCEREQQEVRRKNEIKEKD